MAFKRISTVASSAWRRVSHSPGARHSTDSPQGDDNDHLSETHVEVVNTRSVKEPRLRWSTAELASLDIGVGAGADNSEKILRLEVPFESETGLGRSSSLRKESFGSVSSASNGEFSSDLDVGLKQPAHGSGWSIRVEVATQTDLAIENLGDVIEERRKTLMLEEHVRELEKMLEQCVEQGKQLVARNETLQEELSHLRTCTPVADNVSLGGLVELQNHSLAFKEEMEQLTQENAESQQRLGMQAIPGKPQVGQGIPIEALDIKTVTMDSPDRSPVSSRKSSSLNALQLETLVEDLRNRNEVLTSQLTHMQSAEMQASKIASEKSGLMEQIIILNHEVQDWKEKAHASGEGNSIVRKSLEGLSTQNEQLRSELGKLKEDLASNPLKKANRNSDEVFQRCRELQCRCDELDEKLAVAKNGERKAKRSEEEAQHGFLELQRKSVQLEDETARRAACLAHELAERDLLQRECNSLQSECEKIQHDKEQFEKKAAQSTETRGRIPEDVAQRCYELQRRCDDLDEKLAAAANGEQEAKRSLEASNHGLLEMKRKSAQLQDEVQEMGRDRERLKVHAAQVQENSKAISASGLGKNAIPASKRKGATALLKGLRSGEVAKIVDDMEATQEPEASGASKSDAGKFGQVVSLPMTTSLLKSLGEELMPRSVGDELTARQNNDSLGPAMECAPLPSNGVDLEFLRHECKQLKDQISTVFVDERELCGLVGLLKEELMHVIDHEQASRLLAEHCLQRCTEYESEYGELQMEVLEGGNVIAPLVHDAEAVEAMHRCDLLQVECKYLQNQLEFQAQARDVVASQAVHQHRDLKSECDLLQLEREHLQSELESQAKVAVEQAVHQRRHARREYDDLQVEREHLQSQLEDHAKAAEVATKQEVHRHQDLMRKNDLVRVERDYLKVQLESLANAEKQAVNQQQNLRSEYDLLQVERDHLQRELESQAEMEKVAQGLIRENEELQRKSLESVRTTAAAHTMLEDAASADVLNRCDELRRECEQLRRRSIENARATAAIQPLLEDALFADASRHCDELKRECERLRGKSNENAIFAAATELLLEDAVAETSLRSGSQTQLENELRDARLLVARHEQAEKNAENAVEASVQSNHDLQRSYDALKARACIEAEVCTEEAKIQNREMQTLYEKVVRAEDAERTARLTAEAAVDLIQRKDNLRQCRELREQVARALETDQESRQSAEVAVGLQRLIYDLGDVDLDTTSTNHLSIATATSWH